MQNQPNWAEVKGIEDRVKGVRVKGVKVKGLRYMIDIISNFTMFKL
jgi:hypothetical protein